MSEPKKHHYLPRFYLANFCRDEYLWVRDCEMKENRRQKPENVATINHYYSLEKDGVRDNTIEKGLSQIEGTAKPIIDDLAAGRQISLESKDNLSVFLSFLWLRTPDFQDSVDKVSRHMLERTMSMMFRDEEQIKEVLDEYAKAKGEAVAEIDPKDLLKFVEGKKYKFDIKRIASLDMMLKQSLTFANYFQQMDWLVLHCGGRDSFITTDNPLVLMPPKDFPQNTWRGCGITTPGCKKIVPLTQSCCLMMADKGERLIHAPIGREDVRKTNKFLAGQVRRFMMARDEALVESLKSFGDASAATRDGRLTIN